MRSTIFSLFFLLVALWLPTNLQAGDKGKLSVDGPYILYDSIGNMRFIRVDAGGRLVDTVMSNVPDDFEFKVSSNKGKHHFNVQLHDFQRPAWKLPQAGKMLVISDPHGNLDCFVSVLKNNGVINNQYQWTFGDNQLVIIGDVFDRGKDVLPIFWLIYKLEAEAAKEGGQVLFMLGNHEEMVLRGDSRYTKDKYKALADTLHMPYRNLWKEDSELGRWLRSRNLIQVVSNNLIVHAGVSDEFMNRKESVQEMNETVGKYLSLNRKQRTEASPLSAFMFDTKVGPFWYRGMVKSEDKYLPIDPSEVTRLLKKFKVDRVLVGHTIFDDVATFYHKRVIAVNVDNKENYEKGRGRGVMIEGDKISVVYDKKPMKLLP